MSQVFLQLVVATRGLMDYGKLKQRLRNKVLGTALRMSAEDTNIEKATKKNYTEYKCDNKSI